MKDELRKVLKELLIGNQEKGTAGDFETNEEKQRLDQAEQDILALMDKRFEECLPKKMTSDGMELPYSYLQKLEGWNLCITEIRARWENGKA